MKIDIRPRHKNAGRPPEKSAPGYLKWLRGRKCFIATRDPNHVCEGKVRACHFDPWGDKGMATKVSDRAALPMCDGAHAEQHSAKMGWPRFQQKYGFSGFEVTAAYWRLWPGRAAWERKNEAA